MAQHDYVIANGTGAAVRSDLNNALAAIVSQNSGATAPSTTYAYQWWADTTTGLLKLRNAANNAWITLFQLDGEWSTLAIENGSAAAQSIYFKDSGTDTGIYSPGTDQVAISTGGTGRLFVDSSGRVGLGTSTVGSSGNANITIAGANNSGIQFGRTNATAGGGLLTSASGPGIAFYHYTGAVGSETYTEGMRLTSTGLGIGSTAPGHALQVNGAICSTGGFGSASADTCVIDSNPGLGRVMTTGPSGGGYSALAFAQVNASGGQYTERARIDSSGRLLVGTSTARSNFFNSTYTGLFQVEAAGNEASGRVSSITYGASGTSGPILALAKHRSDSVGGTTIVQNGDEIGVITFQGSDGTQFVEGARISAIVDAASGADDLPSRLVFSTTADGASSPTERMRITSSGDVLINRTSQGFIGGQARFGLEDTSSTRYVLGINANNNAVVFNHTANGSSAVGSISCSTSATTYGTSSDYRLKENIAPLTGAADRVKQLKPSRFNFIIDPDRTVDGFIAHEAQAVVPECVTGTKDEGDVAGNPVYQGIDQSKLVPLLSAALQEALQKIDEMEVRLAALEAS